MQRESIKFTSSVYLEGMTALRALLFGIDSGVNKRSIRRVLISRERMAKIHKEVGYLRAVSEKYGFTVETVTDNVIDSLCIGNTHGGILAECTDRPLPSLQTDTPCRADGFYALIDGIEDPYNFGYALRSLYACGCDGILVPGRNWFSAAGVVARSSAGASEMMPVFLADNASVAVDVFHTFGYTVVCAEEKTENILGRCPLRRPLLLVVGGEKRGISKTVLDAADLKVRIAYDRTFHASLSAASATTMFAYEISRQNAE